MFLQGCTYKSKNDLQFYSNGKLIKVINAGEFVTIDEIKLLKDGELIASFKGIEDDDVVPYFPLDITTNQSFLPIIHLSEEKILNYFQ